LRISINLATEPFRKDRPMLAAFVAGSIALTISLGILVYLIVTGAGRVSDTRVAVNALSDQAKTIAAEQARLDGVLRQPANASVLERSVLLNTLVERKSVSWTKIFADLEEVMPANIRLIQVRLPQIDSQNQVLLDMVVGAKGPAPMIDFLKKLQTSPRFGPATVHNSIPPSDNDPLYRYRVSVNYAQKL
jgi:type IV pilus assembly protein PilN